MDDTRGDSRAVAGLRRRLREGHVVVGPFMKFGDAAAAEIMGLAGFDYVIIDLEHGPLSVETAQGLVRAARLAGAAPVIRVAANAGPDILRALDIGAEGVQVPHVDSAEAAEQAVRYARYHPEGERGVCRYVRAAGYSSEDRFRYFARANEETCVVLHIEGREGVERLEEILTVPGVDVVFLGPYDLSQSLGVPGQVRHPAVIERMQEAVRRARAAGVAVGTFADDVTVAREWVMLGVQYISYSVDVGILYEACRRAASEIKESSGEDTEERYGSDGEA